jgi:uncharacterized protein YbbC (DUF1343 family)
MVVLLAAPLLRRAPAGAGARTSPEPARLVRPGIDVLLSDSLHLIAGRRLGLITNQAGVDASGISSIDRLHALSRSPAPPLPRSPGQPTPRLIALFAPEHGIRGTAAPGERVSDTTDSATGLPIYSLYGAIRAPTRAQLQRLDDILVDLQDVGARPYTWISTVIGAMRAAREAGKRIIVLDRPNPIGCTMQGPVLERANSSFIGMLPVPLRHGMTLGELARFANAELFIGADLVVVPADGWRCEWFDQTGLPWVRPSPNLPDLEALAWYPGTVLFEATNLSVGRGTNFPFTQVGAPWLEVANEHLPAGAWRPLWEPVEFTPLRPGDGKYDGLRCVGRRFPHFDRANGDAIVEALRTLAVLRATNPDSLRVDRRGLAMRLGIAWDGFEPDTAGWAEQRRAFAARAAPHLIYRRR